MTTSRHPRSSPMSKPAGIRFEDWYAESWPRVLRAVVMFTNNSDDAPDLASEACARAFARWDTGSGLSDPTAWTVVVALNLAKRRGRAEKHQHLDPRSGAHRTVGFDEVDLDLWRAVQQLPPRAREAIALRYGSDLTEQSVANAMGISIGTASATLAQARQKLRALLTDGDSDGRT